jgi:predicted CXXCH cytochrome family protein
MTTRSGSKDARSRPRRGFGSFRLSLLAAAPVIAGAWLFLAAIPVLADGGPHVDELNSGMWSLTADGCAGCHRAHSAQGEMLLNASSEEALCFTCHGATGTGATTNVQLGLQYVPSGTGTRTGVILGALRNGGFDQAVLDTANAARIWRDGFSAANQWSKVRVKPDLVPADVTSAHLNLADNSLAVPAVAWGNGPMGTAGAGPSVTIGCTTCHNPHGNGQYRILVPRPTPTTTSGSFVPVTVDSLVKDVPVDPDGNPANGFPTKNYTVIQVKGTGTPPTLSSYMLYASDVLDAFGPKTKPWPPGTYNNTSGDYWHRRVPWNSASDALDAPNGVAAGLNGFNTQMIAWCSSCHTRYNAADFQPNDDPYDPIYYRRHQTAGYLACTTCHVAHGSNAAMGVPAAGQPYPNGAVALGDSRLLKVNGRGTCQLCHDPTLDPGNSGIVGQYTGPIPSPGVP